MRLNRFMFVTLFCLLIDSAYSATLTSTDIDTGTQVGSTTDLGNGDFSVTAGGSDIWDNSDHFRYLSQSWSGDLDIRVRVDSIGNTNVWSKAGVMLRASTDGNAKHISMFVTPGNGFAFQHRDATGAGSSHTSGGANTPPNSWVRLVKRGSLVTGYTSNNGTVWYRVDSATWAGTDPILVGLAATSHDGNNLVTAELRGYAAMVPPGPVNGFISDDINTHIEGATTGVGADGFSVTASGGDIWNNADGFRFVHQSWSGNFDLRAKVESVDFTDYWAKAGVMVRQDTSSGSVHALMCATSQNGYAFQRRTSANGSSDHTWGGDTSYPNSWVRLVRNGNVITGLKSTDGSLWEIVDTLTLSTTDPVEVGFAVTAHNDNLLCKAEFRNVSLTSYTPPVVGIGTGLLAQYFNSPDLSSPAAPFNVPILTRVEADLNNDWTGTSPDLTVSQNNFSARWVGELEPQYSETYTFYLTADDGVRLWIGNALVIDKWIDQPPTTYTATVPLQAGKRVGIKMEYYQRYGQSVAKLKWSSASCPLDVVPQSQLSSSSGVSVALPATSQVSPAFFEGLAWNTDGTAPSVTANGSNGIFISDNNWFANVTLNSDGSPTSTTVTNPVMGGTVQKQITWTATNITGKEDSIDSITIRKGDALLLTASAAPNTVVEIDPDGSGYQFSGAPDQRYPFTYNTAGTFIAKARVPAGAGHDIIGTVTIYVMDADLHKPIAAEVGFERIKNVVVTPSEWTAGINLVSGDVNSLITTTVGPFDNVDGKGTQIHLKALKRGTPVLVVRVGGITGPILAAKEVDEFTVDIQALRGAVVDANTNLGNTIFTMRPYIPNIDFDYNMFAHSSTFAGGLTHFSNNTSDLDSSTHQRIYKGVFDPDTNETVGVSNIEIDVPSGESLYCFTVNGWQASSEKQEIFRSDGVNGCVCWGTVEGTPYLCVGDVGSITVTLTCDTHSADCKGPYVVALDGQPLAFNDGKSREVECDTTTQFITIGVPPGGTYSVAVNGKDFPNVGTVVALNMSASKTEGCVGDVFSFTATANPPGGTFLWSAPGGSPWSQENTSTFSTTYTEGSEDQKEVTVSYLYEGHTCSVSTRITVVQLGLTLSPDHICADGFETSLAVGTIIPAHRGIRYSITGNNSLGCSIGFSTGIIHSGHTGGTITIRAADSVLSDCYVETTLNLCKVINAATADGETRICLNEKKDFIATVQGEPGPDDPKWSIDGNDTGQTGTNVSLSFNTTGMHVVRAYCGQDPGVSLTVNVLTVDSITCNLPTVLVSYPVTFTAHSNNGDFPPGHPEWKVITGATDRQTGNGPDFTVVPFEAGELRVAARCGPESPWLEYSVNVTRITVTLTVQSGATQTNVIQPLSGGGSRWATVKSAGDVVIVANVFPPDATLPDDYLIWVGGTAGVDKYHRNVTATVSDMTSVYVMYGEDITPTLDVWVIWSEMTVKVSPTQTLDPGNDAQYLIDNNRSWSPQKGGGNTLGKIDHEVTPLFDYAYTGGKMEAKAKLLPLGIENVINRTKWEMRRRFIDVKSWDNAGNYFNVERQYKPGPVPREGDDDTTAAPDFKDLDPLSGTSHGEIYDLDVPACSQEFDWDRIRHTAETYVNFQQYATVTLDAEYVCSDNVDWSYSAKIDNDIPVGTKILLNQIILGATTIPAVSAFTKRDPE